MPTVRSTVSGEISAPLRCSSSSSPNSLPMSSVSAAGPETVISLPRTWISAENSRSMTWSSSSLVPSKPTMEWPSGMTIRIVEPGLSLRVSVNSLLSARRPGHRAAPEHVRVHVAHGLPAVLAGIEDDPVPGGLDAVGIRHLPCHGDKLVEEAIAGGRQRRHVRVVVPRDHED